jgi:hypothetical protein
LGNTFSNAFLPTAEFLIYLFALFDIHGAYGDENIYKQIKERLNVEFQAHPELARAFDDQQKDRWLFQLTQPGPVLILKGHDEISSRSIMARYSASTNKPFGFFDLNIYDSVDKLLDDLVRFFSDPQSDSVHLAFELPRDMKQDGDSEIILRLVNLVRSGYFTHGPSHVVLNMDLTLFSFLSRLGSLANPGRFQHRWVWERWLTRHGYPPALLNQALHVVPLLKPIDCEQSLLNPWSGRAGNRHIP